MSWRKEWLTLSKMSNLETSLMISRDSWDWSPRGRNFKQEIRVLQYLQAQISFTPFPKKIKNKILLCQIFSTLCFSLLYFLLSILNIVICSEYAQFNCQNVSLKRILEFETVCSTHFDHVIQDFCGNKYYCKIII